MSSLNINNQPALSVTNATLPPEGPKAIPLTLDFTSVSGQPMYVIQVSQFYMKGAGWPGLSAIQGLYLDNRANASPLVVSVSQTNQNITVAAGFQGYYPLLSPNGGTLTFASVGGVVCFAEVYNIPMPAGTWSTTSGSVDAGFQFDPAGNLETNDINLKTLINGGLSLPTTDTILEQVLQTVSGGKALAVDLVAGTAGGGSQVSDLICDKWATSFSVSFMQNAGPAPPAGATSTFFTGMELFIPKGVALTTPAGTDTVVDVVINNGGGTFLFKTVFELTGVALAAGQTVMSYNFASPIKINSLTPAFNLFESQTFTPIVFSADVHLNAWGYFQ